MVLAELIHRTCEMKKPTIEELEKILNDPNDYPILIMPNGELKTDRRRKGKGFIKTYRKPLGDTY